MKTEKYKHVFVIVKINILKTAVNIFRRKINSGCLQQNAIEFIKELSTVFKG